MCIVNLNVQLPCVNSRQCQQLSYSHKYDDHYSICVNSDLSLSDDQSYDIINDLQDIVEIEPQQINNDLVQYDSDNQY